MLQYMHYYQYKWIKMLKYPDIYLILILLIFMSKWFQITTKWCQETSIWFEVMIKFLILRQFNFEKRQDDVKKVYVVINIKSQN